MNETVLLCGVLETGETQADLVNYCRTLAAAEFMRCSVSLLSLSLVHDPGEIPD